MVYALDVEVKNVTKKITAIIVVIHHLIIVL